MLDCFAMSLVCLYVSLKEVGCLVFEKIILKKTLLRLTDIGEVIYSLRQFLSYEK